MNKAAIKKFAVESRQKLIKSVIERLDELGITDKEVLALTEQGGVYTVKSLTLNEIEKKNREIILSKIKEKGYESFIEEVAYTWFNRIIAIRYMEVNDYLPFRTRVLSSEVQGKVDPDIITEITDHIEELELNRERVIELKEQNKQEELFKYIFIKVCNYLGQFLPVMFEQIEDYTELLLPSLMISNGSVIKDMIESVSEEDWTNQVEIIGWLYQYYIAEKKDDVIQSKRKYKKDEIPFATQLFTPKWLVKYMVQNSLGKYWIENHPEDEMLKKEWDFYLDSNYNELLLNPNLNRNIKIEEIKCFDPACGSGHILVYMFEILFQIYEKAGYETRQIPRLIIENNLYGLEIDSRAYQLTYFAIIMKGMSYNKRLLKSILKNGIKLNLAVIQETNNINDSNLVSILGTSVGEDFEKLKKFINQFYNSKTYGSLTKINHFDKEFLTRLLSKIRDKKSINLDIFSQGSLELLLENLILQAEIMSNTYEVLITNPPYISNKYMNSELSLFISENYPNNKSDLFAAFMEYCMTKVKSDGHLGLLTPYVWMFISSYKELRKNIIDNKSISTLIQLEYNAFESAVVPVCAFTLRNYKSDMYGEYIKLSDFKGILQQPLKTLEAIENPNVYYRYSAPNEAFNSVPGGAIAYWVSKEVISSFKEGKELSNYANCCTGMQTGNNEKYVRAWFEIEINKSNIIDGNIKSKWIKYNCGGESRKWYGNHQNLVLWDNNGYLIRQEQSSVIRNSSYYFQEGISWKRIGSSDFCLRYLPKGFIFDQSGDSMFIKNRENLEYILAFVNSKVALEVFKAIAPTMNLTSGNMNMLPILLDCKNQNQINQLVNENILISKIEWDAFEISWDYRTHPLIRFKSHTVENSFVEWMNFTQIQFNKVKVNEELLNTIFIDIYGLQDELTPDVDDKDITIRKADRDREMKSFISYAVGCMMGRYSLDEEGLIFAGGEFDINKYQTFKADEDGILLISDTEYFEDDLLNGFVEFMKVVYGEETLEENLNFIADTECFKRKATESSRDCLRRYFLKGFMEDHLKVYQKRPIYWMFDSGKQNGFKALIYLHRYNEDTVAKVRTDYLHPLQRKYEAELERLNQLINFESISASEKGKAKKRQEQVHKQLDECTQYDLLLAHVAHQRISLDLDDGVKVNYQKFQNIELTTDGSSKAKKGDLLYKVKM